MGNCMRENNKRNPKIHSFCMAHILEWVESSSVFNLWSMLRCLWEGKVHWFIHFGGGGKKIENVINLVILNDLILFFEIFIAKCIKYVHFCHHWKI